MTLLKDLPIGQNRKKKTQSWNKHQITDSLFPLKTIISDGF